MKTTVTEVLTVAYEIDTDELLDALETARAARRKLVATTDTSEFRNEVVKQRLLFAVLAPDGPIKFDEDELTV